MKTNPFVLFLGGTVRPDVIKVKQTRVMKQQTQRRVCERRRAGKRALLRQLAAATGQRVVLETTEWKYATFVLTHLHSQIQWY